jgi:hypothetical protein
MKKLSKKKTAASALIIAALVLVTIVGVIVALRVTQGKRITISVGDLVEMKTLAYKYLNERNRMLVSSEPEKDPNVADAPVIASSEMSPELAKLQKEDVAKLKALSLPDTFKNFATLAHVVSIQEKGNTVVLRLGESTYFQPSQPGGPPCSSEGTEYYFTFSRDGNRWILTDVKLLYAGTMPPEIEPSVKPGERGGPRVLENPPQEMRVIPEEIKKLDQEATDKIKNRWAIDDRTAEAIESGTYSW